MKQIFHIKGITMVEEKSLQHSMVIFFKPINKTRVRCFYRVDAELHMLLGEGWPHDE